MTWLAAHWPALLSIWLLLNAAFFIFMRTRNR